ncbi:hypothetical protein G9C98_004317 [Cotesia typhae]|uniref:Uncharacterized protein n=1 Tax=Cotesia typhae TaxID=2053667 RepID=A0A8J5QNE2_9HYME|nr:hypothetical protein G9C98_004317 [Cotesia typhae]
MRRKNGPFSDLSVSFFTSSSTIPLFILICSVGNTRHSCKSKTKTKTVWKFTPQLAELNAVDNSEKITKTRKIAQLYKEKTAVYVTTSFRYFKSVILCRVEFGEILYILNYHDDLSQCSGQRSGIPEF